MKPMNALYEIEDLVREARGKLDELQKDSGSARLQDDYDHILLKIKNLIIQLT